MINIAVFLFLVVSPFLPCRIHAEDASSLQFEIARHRLESRLSDYVFGGHLMSAPERSQYLMELKQAKSHTERQAIEEKHRQLILDRAKKRDLMMWERYNVK